MESSLAEPLVVAELDDARRPGTGALLAALVPRSPGALRAGVVAVRSITTRLGREAGNTAVLDAPSVSASHAELRLRGGVWLIEDLGSVNGTWVDGEPVHGVLPVAPGSLLRFGDVELVFSPHDRWEDSAVTPNALPPERSMPAPAFILDDRSRSPAWATFGPAIGIGLLLVAVIVALVLGSR